jgi:uncharacterized protein
MAETFRAPKAVRDEAQASGVTLPDSLSIVNIHEIRETSFGSNTLEWTNKIITSAEQRAVELMEGNPTMAELRDGNPLNGVMAADASIDAAQALLKAIMDQNPIIAQAYYLICAADLALDPVIEALGLTDPDDDTEEENAAAKPEDYSPTEDADAAVKMNEDDYSDEDSWTADDRAGTGAEDLPIAARDKAWSAAAADKRVQKWAGGKDAMDWDKYGKAFFYVDESDKEKLGSYKLQFADIVDGELTAIPRAIFAVAAVLQGARGGVDIPDADKEAIKDKVTAYYAKMAEKFSDEEIKPPFEDRAASARIGEGTFVSWPTTSGRARGRVEKVTSRGSAASSDGYTMEATDDNPVFHVRVYREQGNGWIASDQVNVHRSNYLTIIKPLPSPRKADQPMIEERKTMIRSAEKITMEAELRAVGQVDENFKIAGYAATFNQEATGLNFREMIAPGAFSRSLSTDNPVFLLVNHDTDQLPLASTQSGTLRLAEDDHGLRMEADLDMKNPRAAELASAIERGDVNKMSFAFSVGPDGQTKENGLRTLTDLDLYEVSAVTWPAYNSTSLGARSADEIADLELAKRKLALKFNQYSLRQKRKG